MNNSYIANIDDAIKAIGENPIIKKTILKVLWTQFAEVETESVANYIADKYLLKLIKRLSCYKQLLK